MSARHMTPARHPARRQGADARAARPQLRVLRRAGRMIFTIDRIMEQGSWLDYGMFLENIMVAARARGSTPAAGGLHPVPSHHQGGRSGCGQRDGRLRHVARLRRHEPGREHAGDRARTVSASRASSNRTAMAQRIAVIPGDRDRQGSGSRKRLRVLDGGRGVRVRSESRASRLRELRLLREARRDDAAD